MTRKLVLTAAALALAACAQPGAPPPPPAAPASRPVVPIPPPPPRGEPDLFSGVSADRLRVLLGSPAFIRKDGATEMWRYDARNCRAFFFFYGAGTAAKVRHIETMPQGKSIAADPACLNGLTKKP
jgi:hypothetical protein